MTSETRDGRPAPVESTAERVQLSEEEIERLSADSEGGPAARTSGWLGWVTGLSAFGIAAYALYWTQFSINTTVYRASFLSLCLALAFILFPLVRGGRDGETRAATVEEWIVGFLAAGLLAFVATETNILGRSPGAFVLLVVVGACFALYPLATQFRLFTRTQVIDWVFVAVALYSALYLEQNLEVFKTRPTRPTPEELVLASALVLLILEATRRAIGWILPAIALIFLVYCYFGPYVPEPFDHRGFSVPRILGQNYLTLEGIYSTPVDVAATFIILFTIYGAVLERGGAGRFFIDWAFALFGKNPSKSAPGRAVVASGFLLGTVSGSGVATTVTIASIAWPMLRTSGYPPTIAGGMLSAAGIGATLSPPTLGAAAFIIAEYLDVEYLQILIYASIPTLLYYFSCWLMTEADARRLDVRAVKTSSYSLWQLTVREGYHFLSLGAIAVFLVLGYTSFMAVFWSIAVAFLLSMMRPESRLVTLPAFAIGVAAGVASLAFAWSPMPAAMGLDELFDGRLSVAVFWGMTVATLVSGAQAFVAHRRGVDGDPAAARMIVALVDGTRSTLGIVATCACAGLIVCVVNLTGLGLTISSIIVSAGGGERLFIILLAALGMWVLGLAVPVTASYIIAAVMLVPALVKVGIAEPAAHMFMFYYAVLADVSPPTALAPFAAAAICGGQPFVTTLQAWKYTLPAFIVPVMFCLTPDGLQLLMLTPAGQIPDSFGGWWGILVVTVTSCLALVGLCIGLTGYALAPANALERGLAVVGGALLLAADVSYDIAGAVLLTTAIAAHALRVRRRPQGPAPAT